MTTWNKQGFRSVFTSTNQPGRLLWSGPGQVLFVYGEGKLLWGKGRGEQMEWETVSLPAALPQEQACADAEGRVWYLRSQPQVGVWEKGESRTCPLEAQLAGQQVKVLASAQGRIWLGTEQA